MYNYSDSQKKISGRNMNCTDDTDLTREVVSKLREIRPRNTKLAYEGPQKEYIRYAESKYGCSIVTAERVLSYLVNHLTKREKKNSKGKKVGKVIVGQHIKALVDLYRFQSQVPVDNATTVPEYPRSDAVKKFLKMIERSEYEKEREEYVDRGIGTIVDGYSNEEYKKIASYHLFQNTVPGLRNRLDHLLGDSMLLRGNHKRQMELADCFSIKLNESEGLTECIALVAVSRNGKTNKNGRVEYSGCLRNVEVDMCAVGAFFMYMFARFACEEEFPNVFIPEEWYRVKVLKGKDKEHPISYHAQYEAIRICYDALGIKTKKKTHANRGSGVRRADVAGTEESQLRRLGGWNSDALSTSYLTNLPMEALRAQAGFSPKSGKK